MRGQSVGQAVEKLTALPTGQQINWLPGQTDGQTDRQTDRWTDRRTNVERMRLSVVRANVDFEVIADIADVNPF